MNEEKLTRVKSITNVIESNIFVELKDKVVELETGKSLFNVDVKNISSVRPYTKILENLTEVTPN